MRGPIRNAFAGPLKSLFFGEKIPKLLELQKFLGHRRCPRLETIHKRDIRLFRPEFQLTEYSTRVHSKANVLPFP